MGPLPNDPEELDARQRELYQRRQRRKLETYLQQMIRWLIFRPDSTRLCKFLELSALAIRLSAEGGYQGKQGLLTIMSAQARKLRQSHLAVSRFTERHRPKWFLVRHSYIICVDGPESLNPYDVFLVDSEFSTEKPKKRKTIDLNTPQEVANTVFEKGLEAGTTVAHGKHHLLRLYNTERKLKLIARTERLYLQFQESINLMAQATIWSKKQRFASYAPVRNNVWARWLVDGRDHMWQISRAIDNAKDFVYIHDWWLSPELYLRRPAAISQKWRIDRLLQRKAQEGVKIFVIVYRNIESAIPIDSEYTKWSLLDLHENICIQRSPNQFRQNQFFWAHHEKLVVVDNMMAFVGGIDLCFGRWDDPCHTLTDDKLTGFEINHDGPRDSETCQVWPGKDYSNPRVQDFYALDRPYEEMYDRTRVPRMPWHDIGMQLVGQPARDVGRHFVQRWNYILRSRIPSRPTPILIPPPEYEQAELESLGMTGTCQVQILRSCGHWSIGTPNKVEHSIMNAYVHLIRHSQHFVYIENQFFITSCVVEGTTIHNKIGDALVDRIIRAYENDEHWGACIVIPLMPGFQNSVDSQDGTSIRLIMQCQFRSICRGETSIFGRLRAKGIDPEDYIRFYSLRQWGKIGPRKCLTTEQLYIHAKCMVVDDRSVIIGSANINERSLLGGRDSEVAAVVTDTRMIPSFMGGEPYDVGEFAHSLRKRLMREHLGVDVDAIYRREQAAREREEQDAEMARIYQEGTAGSQDPGDYFAGALPPSHVRPSPPRNVEVGSSGNVSTGLAGTTRVGSAVSLDVPPEQPQPHDWHKKFSADVQHDLDVDGYGFDNMKALVDAGDVGLIDSFIDTHGREVLLHKDSPDAPRVKELEEDEAKKRASREPVQEKPTVQPPYPMERMDTYALGLLPRSQLPELPALDDTDIGGPALTRGMPHASTLKPVNPLMHTLKRPKVHEDCMIDPLVATFYYDIWHQVAENNTKIYRQVFRCMPDSEVLDWRTYEKFNEYNERFMQAQGLGSSKPRPSKEAPDKSGPPGSGGTEVSSIASVAAQVASETRPRSKSVLSNFVDKLRPSSRLSEDKTHTDEMREKEEINDEKKANESPEQPGSRGSSGPTAAPSPKTTATDEKEAHKLADQAEENGTENPMDGTNDTSVLKSSQEALNEKEGIIKEDMAFARQKTVQYSDDVNLAPETTATQSVNPSGLQHSGSQKRRRRGTTKSSARVVPEEVLGREEAEELLKLVQGHLVLWPYEWYVHFCLSFDMEPTNHILGLRRKSEVETGCIILTNWHRWKSMIDCCSCVCGIWTHGS
jgi:phospholipase D1/2